MPDTRRHRLLKLHRASHRGRTHLRAPVCAMQGSTLYVGKGVQRTPQETEKPTTKNKKADGRRSTRRQWTQPGPETLVQHGWQLTTQVPISMKTTVMVEIGIQDLPGLRNQEKAAEETRHQEGRHRNGEYESAFLSGSSTASKNVPPNNEFKILRQTIQTLRAENAKLLQKLNELIDELKALRTGHTNVKP
ncbi:hypothetical protein HPB51_026216 [Rhipicephalus microplus]|uniref:Uncharacterized protein n=1 Tax=Rhipicephalus microplus TaxID=6941 RepID=A0A9J6DYA6_RHIMP|nr:hypothetical protein HPB51_026216 [Rhipicephalus microplus]